MDHAIIVTAKTERVHGVAAETAIRVAALERALAGTGGH